MGISGLCSTVRLGGRATSARFLDEVFRDDIRGTMAGRDDGEFELILGNKQLLSVLFIVIVLLGVFFAMGFLAGRTTGVGSAIAQTAGQDRQPLSVDSASSKPPAAAPEPIKHGEPEPAAVPPPAPVRETRPEPEPEKPAAAKAAKVDSGGYIATPPTGSYLQAAATRRADAEAMLAGIRSKTGLGGFVTPSPKNAELFRVIVGPLSTKSQQAEARVKLGEIGVKNPFLVNY